MYDASLTLTDFDPELADVIRCTNKAGEIVAQGCAVQP